MSDYRQFKLINSVGAEYDLCDVRHLFVSPDGLGFARNYESLQAGSSFVLIEDLLEQQTITGEMIFADYEEYSAFAKFIKNDGMKLAYCPANFDIWYYRSCQVESLKKSEISHTTNRLHCNVDFCCFSQWYEPVFAERTLYELNEDSVFPLTFPFTFEDRNINEVIIVNSNTDDAPCKITIAGPCSNPHWELKSNGQLVASGKVAVSLAEGESLIVDANIESMRIVKASESTETNVYQSSDFSTDRFIYAPNGKSVLRFYHDESYALDVVVEVRKVADTV